MVLRIFVAIIVIIAVVVGVLNVYPAQHDMLRLAIFAEFFSASLPILAFGALVKFLCTCKKCGGTIGCGSNGCCSPASKGKCCCGSGKCCCGKDVRAA